MRSRRYKPVTIAENSPTAVGLSPVPANDNVSLSSFLKYLEALGLLTPFEEAASPSAPGPRAVPQPAGGVLKFRQRAKTG